MEGNTLLTQISCTQDVNRNVHLHDSEISAIRITNETADKDTDKIAKTIAKVSRKTCREKETKIFSCKLTQIIGFCSKNKTLIRLINR